LNWSRLRPRGRRVTGRLFAREDVGETRQREQVAKLLAGVAETEPDADP
jgi:hypothetical protein